MNRLILKGNAFDLAHKMKTTYADFILSYVKSAFGKAYKGMSSIFLAGKRFKRHSLFSKFFRHCLPLFLHCFYFRCFKFWPAFSKADFIISFKLSRMIWLNFVHFYKSNPILVRFKEQPSLVFPCRAFLFVSPFCEMGKFGGQKFGSLFEKRISPGTSNKKTVK